MKKISMFLLGVIGTLCSTAGGSDEIAADDKAQLKALVGKYGDAFTAVTMEERFPPGSWTALFSGEGVMIPDDFEDGKPAFRGPLAFLSGEEQFFLRNSTVSDQMVELSDPRDHVYLRTGAEYWVYLRKKVSYRLGSMERRNFCFWQRLQIERVDGEFKIVGIEERERLKDLLNTSVTGDTASGIQDTRGNVNGPGNTIIVVRHIPVRRIVYVYPVMVRGWR